MIEVRKSIVSSLALVALLLSAGLVLGAQSKLVLDQGYAGAVTVSGKVAPGNGSVSIYDVSNTPRTELGVSESVDKNGNFAVTVKPALISGHKIVAEDAKGAISEEMVVISRPSGPAGPP
jgi:hypothetical protein